MADEESKPSSVDSQEIWKPLTAFENSVEISSLGRMRYKDGRSIKQYSKPYNRGIEYFTGSFSVLDTHCQVMIHRAVCRAFHGDPGPLPIGQKHWYARHLDGNTFNNAAINLAWGTPTQNMEDMARHGTLSKGEDRYNAILNESTVLKIHKLFSTGEPLKAIEEKFKINHATLYDLLRGKTWKHLGLTFDYVPAPVISGKGKLNRNAKLCDESVRAIRKSLAAGCSQRELAAIFKVSDGTIHNIKAGKIWKHLL